jgi:hypothetical protein
MRWNRYISKKWSDWLTWLYCAAHGREREGAVKRRQADIRRDGESVLIVKGKLISGPWRCDSCNAELNEGATAYLHAAYPRPITEAMDEYGFEMERDYFALAGEDKMALYGSPWPGGPLAQMLGRSRVTAGLPPRRRPLSATELLTPKPMAAGEPEPGNDGQDEEPGSYPELALPPVYVLRTAERCPECRRAMHVHTLGCHSFRHHDDPYPIDDFHFLRQIERVPEEVMSLLKAKCPGYTPDTTREGETPYLMDHCACGAKLDDDYLHGDVGAAFRPDTPDGYKHIKLFRLPIDEAIPVTSSWALGGGDYLDYEAAEDWQALDA